MTGLLGARRGSKEESQRSYRNDLDLFSLAWISVHTWHDQYLLVLIPNHHTVFFFDLFVNSKMYLSCNKSGAPDTQTSI